MFSKPRRSARMTHLCSLNRPTRGTRFAYVFARGQELAIPAAVLLFFVTRSFFPNQLSLTNGPSGRAVLLRGGKSSTAPVWWWVTFGEQSRVISREC